MSKTTFVLAALASASQALPTLFSANDVNQDIILSPLESKSADLEEKMLVFIPGADVATEYYSDTAAAIQEASNLRLWVIIPAIPSELCISYCSTAATCGFLDKMVTSVFEQAVAQGFAGTDQAPDTFLAGHSLGGSCASNLSEHRHNKGTDFQALIEMGSYVSNHDVAGWPIPVMTLGAELDGGLGRPGMLNIDVVSSDNAAIAEGQAIDSDWQATNKPVVILPGMDHSDFCPGFHVPGDVYPSAVDESTAMSQIGDAVSAFMHLHTEQSESLVQDALSYIKEQSEWTRDNLLHAYRQALLWEKSADEETAPWCEMAEIELSGLSAADKERMNVISVNEDTSKHFEDTRVSWAASGNEATFNVSGFVFDYTTKDIADSCYTSALELGCKLASSDRVAQQLDVASGDYDNSATCGSLNEYAQKKALELLSETSAGQAIIDRHTERGRPMCFMPDFAVPGNVGPLWVSTHMTIEDNGECLEVASLHLGPQGLRSPIFPGVHYCKLISPARIVDYYMIDSLKALGGCLNKDPSSPFSAFFQ